MIANSPNLDDRLDRIAQLLEDLTSGLAQIAQDVRVQRLDLSEVRGVVKQQAAIAVQQADNVSRLAMAVERQAELFDKLLDLGVKSPG
jgi:methyl-accepting chemotaxis protein